MCWTRPSWPLPSGFWVKLRSWDDNRPIADVSTSVKAVLATGTDTPRAKVSPDMLGLGWDQVSFATESGKLSRADITGVGDEARERSGYRTDSRAQLKRSESQARRPICEVKESPRQRNLRMGGGGETSRMAGWQMAGWHMLCLRHSNVSATLTKSSPR